MDGKVGRVVRKIIPRKRFRVKTGKTEKHINSIISSMYEGGADVIMLGGSIGAQGVALDEMAKMIKESVDVPLHLFPGNISNITKYADSIYFMSLLNSKNPYWISGAQSLGAPMIKKYKIDV